MAKKLFRSAITLAGTLAGLLLFSGSAGAIDIYPADYTVAPPGTNLALVYLGYTPSNNFSLDGGGKVPQSSLDQTVGIIRWLHYSEIGGMPVAYQFYLPFARLSNAKVGGQDLQVNNGIGDLTLGFTAFLLKKDDANYGTTVGLTAYVSVDTGKYDFGKVGAGVGTTTYTPQLGIIQGLGHGFYFDGALDVAVQRSHNEQDFHVDTRASTEVQAYLRYQFSPASSLSFGYAGFTGGKQYINSIYQQQETRSNQVRIFGSHMLTPTWQLAGTLGKALSAQGGFKEQYNAQLRLMKIF